MKYWLFTVTAEKKGFIRSPAEEKRYRDVLFRKAEKEMVDITDYVCREGKIFVIMTTAELANARKIINTANASFGKYKKLMLENICFDPVKPEFLGDVHQYTAVKQQIFNTFYVAEGL